MTITKSVKITNRNTRLHTMSFLKYILPVLIIVCFSSCKKQEEKKEEVLRPVKYQIAGTSSGERIRTFSGVAKAADEVALSFRAEGIITQVNVSVGDKVKKGDLIARLDNVEARLALEKSVSALTSAQSDMNTVKNELERIKSLYERNSVSLSDYQAAKNTYQIALSQYESAKRNKIIQETQISYGYIYSPKDGVIANTDGGVDESVSAGHQFATLNAGGGMQIEVGIPENLINEITLGMKVSLSFSALGEETFSGAAVEIAQVSNLNGATYPVKVDIANPANTIRPGMAANVTFRFGNKSKDSKDELIIPIKAVGEDGDGNFVFVIESEDGKIGYVRKRKVTIGEISSDGFQITSGLSEGELIATAGLQTLLDGQKVKIQ